MCLRQSSKRGFETHEDRRSFWQIQLTDCHLIHRVYMLWWRYVYSYTMTDLGCKYDKDMNKILKVIFLIYIVDRTAILGPYTCKGVKGKAFMLHCVNPATLPLVRCYSICLPWWYSYIAEWTSAGNELNRPVSTSPVVLAEGWCNSYDVKLSVARIRTNDLWIGKRMCYLFFSFIYYLTYKQDSILECRLMFN